MENKYLEPLDAPVTSDRPQIGFDFDTKSDRGMVKAFQLKGAVVDTGQIADDAITNDKIASTAVSTGNIQNGAVTSIKLADSFGTKLIIGGTVGTAVIGTCSVVGGTVGTSLIAGGTVGTSLIGTSTITGGTIDAGVYKGNGSAGLSTAIGYLSAATVAGTLLFAKGLLVQVT